MSEAPRADAAAGTGLPASGAGELADLHIPVMRDRILDLLAPALQRPGAVYVDATLGIGGHALSVLEAHPQAVLVGVDRDPEALALAARRLAAHADRIHLVEAVYDEFPEVLAGLHIAAADAILMDLGVSSLQIDRRDRGFAYSVDAPLDMRMDGQQPVTAASIVNEYPERDLARIFSRYGEEQFADRIARRIVQRRGDKTFDRSGDLVDVVAAAIPMAARSRRGHPAKRVFQALRIEVNRELEVLDRAVPAALESLAVGGRLAVLAYHSLEDRIVKTEFRAATSDSAPPGLPIVPDALQARFTALTRGAEQPSTDEIVRNPRAASARLRAVERVRRAA